MSASVPREGIACLAGKMLCLQMIRGPRLPLPAWSGHRRNRPWSDGPQGGCTANSPAEAARPSGLRGFDLKSTRLSLDGFVSRHSPTLCASPVLQALKSGRNNGVCKVAALGCAGALAGSPMRGTHRGLYSSEAERQSCKLEVLGSVRGSTRPQRRGQPLPGGARPEPLVCVTQSQPRLVSPALPTLAAPGI